LIGFGFGRLLRIAPSTYMDARIQFPHFFYKIHYAAPYIIFGRIAQFLFSPTQIESPFSRIPNIPFIADLKSRVRYELMNDLGYFLEREKLAAPYIEYPMF